MKAPAWPPKDIRQFLTLILLAGGGVAMTIIVWRSVSILEAAKAISPIANISYGALGLIGIVFIGLTAVLGRRSFKGSAGPIQFEAEGGDE